MRENFEEESTSRVELNFDSIISAAAYSVRYLTKLSQISFEETSMRELTVNPAKATTDYKKTMVIREPSVLECRFLDLPVNLLLIIFSYLDARTLCKTASTSKYWKMISEDKVLWGERLSTDLKKWKYISHMTYPPTYLETNSDLTTKEVYLQCCPSCELLQQSKVNSKRTYFASMFLSNLQNIPHLFSKRPIKVVMFGPGLESETKSITQAILWGAKSPFKVTGLFPGEFEGVGSGVCLKLKNNVEINLITLYGSTSAERERNAREGKERVSKLLEEKVDQVNNNGDEDALSSAEVEVSHSVKELCKTVDGFIYVVNSSTHTSRVNSENQELNALMNANWTRPRIPLLVLSCVATMESHFLTCAAIVEMLQMTQLNRPWQVNSVCVENLDGFLDGVLWLIKQAS